LIKATDYIGSLILENDTLQFIQTAEGRVVPKTVDGVDKNEYQYHLKDHLGNVRTTFAVRDDDYQTSFETVENPYFDNYDQITRLANFMKKSGSYSHRLTGGGTDIVGLMKTLYVSKGDKISAEVYGKYLDAQFTDEGVNGAALINALVTMLGGGTITGEGTIVQNNLNTDFISAAMADDGQESSPKAYLNYILLDKNFNYLNSGFERLSESAADPGDGTGTHQRLSFEEILIEEDGYLMVFLSNESDQSVEVFWDDFRVGHHYNAVLQADDYYPFGLTFNSYQREFSKKNKMNTFQDQEYEEETGWVKFKWRNHDPAIGRFFNIDPLAEDYYYNSPYAFSENDVISAIELEGLEKLRITNYSLIQSQKLKESFNRKSQIESKPVSKSNSRRSKLNNLNKEYEEINRIFDYSINNGFEDDYMSKRLKENNVEVPEEIDNGEATLKVEVIDPDAELSFEVFGVNENKDGAVEINKIGELNEGKEKEKVDIETVFEISKIVLTGALEYLAPIKVPKNSMPIPQILLPTEND
jgi:RHS repeat-associated protein